jgi:hypothetical protein
VSGYFRNQCPLSSEYTLWEYENELRYGLTLNPAVGGCRLHRDNFLLTTRLDCHSVLGQMTFAVDFKLGKPVFRARAVGESVQGFLRFVAALAAWPLLAGSASP